MAVNILDGSAGGNHIAKLAEFVKAHPEVRGNMSLVLVFHDDDCSIHAGKPCDCSPDIELAHTYGKDRIQ